MDERLAFGTEDRDGTRLANRYTLGARLGGGGMAVVYRAFDDRLRREVAVKLLDASHDIDREQQHRFEAEARLSAAIAHPNVVTVHDVGTEGDLLFIVMECLPGPTLADELRAGPMTPARAVAVLTDVLAGLAAADAQDVLHRDIKPGNVLIEENGTAKLADFGIATPAASDRTETLVFGTAAYLAPERVAGHRATRASDIYAVGVVAYEALAGEPPFTGDSPLAVAHAIHAGAARPLRDVRRDVPRSLSELVMRAMSVDPTKRPATAHEFATALASIADAPASTVAVDAPPTVRKHAATPVDRTTRIAGVRADRASQTQPARRVPWQAIALVLVAAVVIGLLAGGLWSRLRDEPDDTRTPTVTTTVPEIGG